MEVNRAQTTGEGAEKTSKIRRLGFDLEDNHAIYKQKR